MKKIMKGTIISLALLTLMCISNAMHAQDTKNLVSSKATSLGRKYLRPSLTKIYITDGTSAAITTVNSLKTVVDEKYDYNNVARDVFSMDIPAGKKERDVAVKEYIEQLFEKQSITNQIIHTWFPADDTGELSDAMLIQRGQYAATDNDVMKSNSSKRNTLLNELGEQLIDRSYIIVYVVVKDKNPNSSSTHVIPYVYKLDYNAEIMDIFYNDCYSVSGIDSMAFPTQFVTSAKTGQSVTPGSAADDYDDIMNLIRKVSDFQVKTPVTATHPIRANIGKKEGVKCDKRYAVMRLVSDKEGKTKSQRVATVRATTKIIDNRNIADGTIDKNMQTRFYETKGRKVIVGETLVENPDVGINIVPEFTLSEASLSLEYRLGKNINIPGFFVYLKAGLPLNQNMGLVTIRSLDKEGKEKNFQVITASLGISKEINFGGAFALTPSVEGGYLFALGAYGTPINDKGSTIRLTDSNKAFDSKSFKIGGNIKLGYYLTRNIQFYLNAGYNYYIISDGFETLQNYWGYKENKSEKDLKFANLSLGAGIKIGF